LLQLHCDMEEESAQHTPTSIPPSCLSNQDSTFLDMQLKLLQQMYTHQQPNYNPFDIQTQLNQNTRSSMELLKQMQLASLLAKSSLHDNTNEINSPILNSNVNGIIPGQHNIVNINISENSNFGNCINIDNKPTRKTSAPASSSTGNQTISQTTKDKLKSMIAIKKQKSLTENSIDISLQKKNNINLPNQNRCQQTITSGITHYEPYPKPSTTPQQSNEFRLRKVNSEPNLKMKIRQRLLTKNSGCHGTQTPTYISPIHNTLKRSESTDPAQLSCPQNPHILLNSASISQLNGTPSVPVSSSSFIFNSSMIPSPSLPNLHDSLAKELATTLNINHSLLSTQGLSTVLSMPSLNDNAAFSQINSLLDFSVLEGFRDTNGMLTPNKHVPLMVPAGGYQSLLKQQLRDLVLRRKSLVKEEPEEENSTAEAIQNFLNLRNIVPISSDTQFSDSNSISDNNIEVTNIITNQNSTFSGILSKGKKQCGLAYDNIMGKHQCICKNEENHIENNNRITSIIKRLKDTGLMDECEIVSCQLASVEQLCLVHSPTYVTFFGISPLQCAKVDSSKLPIKSFIQLDCGGIGIDGDTYFNDATTHIAVRAAVGTLIKLASLVAEDKLQNGFACIRPPGHHAEKELALGFCYFNNIAIATKFLQLNYRHKYPKIAIIDWGVHHGNGTQSVFLNDDSVLFISLHKHEHGNFFPGSGSVTECGEGKGKGYNVNIPFSGAVMGDTEYLAAWRAIVMPILKTFNPSFIFVSAGFDGSIGHSAALGGYELSPQLFGVFTSELMKLANGKVVLSLEGGYELSSLAACVESCVKALLGKVMNPHTSLSMNALTSLPNDAAVESIQRVIACQNKYWPILNEINALGVSEIEWQTSSQNSSLNGLINI
uniref:histone deacetylase n=2 Tax=Strongyloides stercoralis TaxID=6248 RepID=A0AAF5CWD4_STRER